MKTEIAFTGEVLQATCPCHKDQFFVMAFIVDPVFGKRPIGNQFFADEKAANDGMVAFVNECADYVLKAAGFKREDAVKVEVTHDAAADRSTREFMARNNPNLH